MEARILPKQLTASIVNDNTEFFNVLYCEPKEFMYRKRDAWTRKLGISYADVSTLFLAKSRHSAPSSLSCQAKLTRIMSMSSSH